MGQSVSPIMSPHRQVQFAFAQVLYSTDTCEIYLTLTGCEITNSQGPQSIEKIQGYMLTQVWEDD